MKKSILYFSVLLTLLLASCTIGEDGRDGVNGVDGVDGLQGRVMEIDGVDFDYNVDNNDYSARITFSEETNFVVEEDYSVLIYRFDREVNLSDGLANNWSLIPQNFFIPEGTIQYIYSHNFVDTDIFIEGNFDLANLSTDFTQNQFFRIVFVPSDFLTSKIDKSNINNIMAHFGIEEKDVQKVKLN